jgi:predicted N-acetyltransferase YhbS
VSAVQIRPLSRRAEWIDSLCRWHYREWGALYGEEWSEALCRAELVSHADHDGCPGTWVAEREGRLLGSVSVVSVDAESLRDTGAPWLASLYVNPAHRGQGVARVLIKAAERAACDAGFDHLWLFTLHHAGYYTSLGWQSISKARVHATSVTVMRRALSAA